MPYRFCRGVDERRAVVNRVDLHAMWQKPGIESTNLVSQAFERGQRLFPALQQHGAFYDVALAVSPHPAERWLVTFVHVGNIAQEDWRAASLRDQYGAHLRNSLTQAQPAHVHILSADL